MLDDTRSEVKLKTEKLLKKVHFLVGSQVIDMCPQNKLQRVQDLITGADSATGAASGIAANNTTGSSFAGGGTFGAVGASNLIVATQGAYTSG